jgi:ATP-dependent Clp protease ATP-binding subunit ClpC
MNEKMSNELRKSFAIGRELSIKHQDNCLRLVHVIYGVITSENIISDILKEKIGDYDLFCNEIESFNKKQSNKDPEVNSETILKFDKELSDVLKLCRINKTPMEDIGVELFMLLVYEIDLSIIKIFDEYGVTKKYLKSKLEQLKASSVGDEREIPIKNENLIDKVKSKTPIIDGFTRDLTALANEGKLDLVIGRNSEVERVSQILSRRKKNNPILIGEPGVGKTAIAEGLAIMIANNECPNPLQGKRLVSLDLTSLVAGTKYRGQFEERIKGLLDEARENSNIIMFIDEIHTMIGTGNSSGSLDVANVFKPALARGEIQCIGATTLKEYHENIEKDGALERRFQKVIVNPPSLTETITILSNIKNIYENFHNVEYTEAAIETTVRLAERYITNREFPDKAIDIMDEAGSRKQISVKTPDVIKTLEAEIKEIQIKKENVVKSQDYEEAAELRDLEKTVSKKLIKEKELFKKSLNSNKIIIDDNVIYEVVSHMTGIPVNNLSEDEIDRLLNIEKIISGSVIGQDEAIEKITSAIKRNRTGIRKQQKPIGSFMFIGPTGVGKTELAKTLAKNVFGSEDSIIRFDMSEYGEKFNITKLIGSPPGYIGYNEGGQLTEKVKNKPYSLILFDEIEKAHPDIFNVMLQLLDEGHLTDASGRKINFKNTIIIMTSNIGLKEVQDFGTKIGFSNDDNKLKPSKAIIEKNLKKFFKPEFLNRLDDIIYFNNLKKDEILQIVDIQLNELSNRLFESNYTFKISKKAKEKLAELGYDDNYGARELQRVIQKHIEDEMSEQLLKHRMPTEAKFDISYNTTSDKIIVKLV